MLEPPVEATHAWTSGRRPQIPETVLDLCSRSGPLQPLDASVLLRLSQLAYYDQPYPGHGRASDLWDLSPSTIRNAIDRALVAGVVVARRLGPGRPHAYTLHDPARETQPSLLHPAPDAQPTLPPSRGYPAPEAHMPLTTDVPTPEVVNDKRPRQQPHLSDHGETWAAQHMLARLVAQAQRLRPDQIDTERCTAQLATLELSVEDLAALGAAMIKQLDGIVHLGRWLHGVGLSYTDDSQAATS